MLYSKRIRTTSLPIGRPPKHVSAESKNQSASDEAIRNHVEGKFGQGKRRFGLGRIIAKLASTSAAQISLPILVMNLELALRRIILWLALLRCGSVTLAGPWFAQQGRLQAMAPTCRVVASSVT